MNDRDKIVSAYIGNYNEKDNYTNAVMAINIEFLKNFNGETTQETTQEIIPQSSNRIMVDLEQGFISF